VIDEDDGEEIDDSEWDDESDNDEKWMEDHEIEEANEGGTNGSEKMEKTENMAVTTWRSQIIKKD
jgi:hypothetical protein